MQYNYLRKSTRQSTVCEGRLPKKKKRILLGLLNVIVEDAADIWINNLYVKLKQIANLYLNCHFFNIEYAIVDFLNESRSYIV